MGYDLERKPFALKLKKLARFSEIYGTKRALVKAAGRLQLPILRHLVLGIFLPKKRFVSVIGCGQFAFSTICYFLYKRNGNVFLDTYDIDADRQKTLSDFYNFKNAAKSVSELINNPELKLLYVASNHASHTPYACMALEKNIDVYIEKPISIDREQFEQLKQAMATSTAKVYIGYNRPFSAAIQKVNALIVGKQKPMTIACFISGHLLDEDHWYRDPAEGTRVCGNVGHWLDLSIHMMNKRGHMPHRYEVQISYADTRVPDDNISINLTTEYNDLISIVITSRTEPFDGIHETINLQCGDVIATINDFRSLTIWQNEKKWNEEYSPKDVGHNKAVNQPFEKEPFRQWKEIDQSTQLMLYIADMVRNKVQKAEFDLNFEKVAAGVA